jgi:D-inositol-3-phosphate glycosyltransferase
MDKILLVGVYIPNMGFTRVMEHISNSIVDLFEIHFLGLGYTGQKKKTPSYTLYPCNPNGSRNLLGTEQFKILLDRLRPKFCFILHDIGYMYAFSQILKQHHSPITSVVYLPVDGYLELENEKLIVPLAVFDHCVFYTSFGRDEISKFLPKNKLNSTSVIPHGTNSEVFHILDSDQSINLKKARQSFFRDRPELNDAFIVLNANRPWARKRLDITVKGFADFAKGKPLNVKLYLHHSNTSEQERKYIIELINEHKIYNRLLINKVGEDLSDMELNCLYNSCDVGVNTTMGEGWGLVNMEHACTKAPQIISGQAVLQEIWDDHASYLEVGPEKRVRFSPLLMQEPKASDLTVELEKLYSDKIHFNKMAALAYSNTHDEVYQWKNIEMQWRQLFLSFKDDT